MISVIIPCYNYGRFLPDAVASIVAQTFHDWELIIVDDGSPDDSLAVARRLAAGLGGQRIRVITQPNSGAAAARNTGAAYARGEYILFIDADDLLAPTMLARASAILDTNPKIGFVYSGMQLFGEDNYFWPSVPFDLRALALDNIVPMPALLRRIAWEQIGGLDSAIFGGFEDWDFWLRLALAGWLGHHIPEPLFFYRRHGKNSSYNQEQRTWAARAQFARRHPNLYGPRLAAWGARHCARLNLPAHPKCSTTAVAGSHEVFPTANDTPLIPTAQWPQPCNAPISLTRRLIRGVPFGMRIRMRRTMRRAQLLIRSAGLWL